MSLYKYNITVKVDDEDDKYNEMTIRHAGINFIRNECDKLEKEDGYTLQYLLRGG